MKDDKHKILKTGVGEVLTLTSEQKQKIRKYAEQFEQRFRAELASGDWKKERREKTALFQKTLTRRRISQLSEPDFSRIIKTLWASALWGNKDYLVNKILNDNGLSQIRKSLEYLLWTDSPITERFDKFRATVKGLGPSSITEILVFVFPDRYSLWNDKPKNVLPLLGMKSILPDRVYKYSINGSDYVKCHQALALVKQELEDYGFSRMDFLDLDIFMWLLFLEVVKKEALEAKVGRGIIGEKPEIDTSKLSHWDVMGLLLELGNLLGFDTYVADRAKKSKLLEKSLGEIALLNEIPPFTYQRHLETVKNVDVIWFKEEFPAYCFEVEHTTGVTMGLLRLYQIRKFIDTKFFVIAPTEIISKFEAEIAKDPFSQIKDRYIFRSYDDLATFYEKAEAYRKLENKFFASESG